MSMSGLPFDDFRALLRELPGPDTHALVAAKERNAQLTKPAGSLGRLEEIAMWLAAWSGRSPAVTRPLVAIFAGNHGVTRHGVTPYPTSVTQQMVENFAAGGAAINQICVANDLGLKIFDLALDYPTGDITCEPALSERDCAATMAFGMEALAKQPDILLLGEITAGGRIAAAALALVLFGGEAGEWIEGDEAIVARAADRARAQMGRSADPLEALRQVGGREISALAGAILAARTQNVPVILGGYGAAMAAAVLQKIDPRAVEHVLAGDASGYRGVAEEMGLSPLIDYGIVAGEGVSAVAALPMLKLACEAAG